MPKPPILKPRQIIAVLEKAGFRQVRQKGSHIQFKRGNLLVTVPNHPGDVNPQVLKSILRQAQMSVRRTGKLAEITHLESKDKERITANKRRSTNNDGAISDSSEAHSLQHLNALLPQAEML